MSENNIKEEARQKKVNWLTDGIAYSRDAKVLMVIDSSVANFFNEQNTLMPVYHAGYKIAPWGPDNLLPQRVMQQIDRVEIVGTNANFNWKVPYGCGPKLVKLIYSDNPAEQVKDKNGKLIGGKVVDQLDIFSGEVYDWCERNDISMYLQETLTDLSYFHNAFALLVPSADRKSIYTLRHREAMFSRWGIDKSTDQINRHLYSAKWDLSPAKADIESSYVIDEFDAIQDIRETISLTKEKRMVYPIYMPSPGRPYYSYPNWYSIFRSGWFDNVAAIPAIKKAIQKHNLGVRNIIYISPKYFEEKAELEGIDTNDMKAKADLKQRVVDEISTKLVGEENAGAVLNTLANYIPAGNGAVLEKYFTIEKVDNNITGGEQLADYESGANIISYAMEVHPSLIGATPGKNSNSLSGSNQRELFLMKQALSKPLLARALRPFNAIKVINGWPSDYAISVPEFVFTTLDEAKSGKKESQNNIAK